MSNTEGLREKEEMRKKKGVMVGEAEDNEH